MGKKQLSDQNWKTHTHPQWSRNAPGLIDQSISSVAILAEISYFARNLTWNADENFRSIGLEQDSPGSVQWYENGLHPIS